MTVQAIYENGVFRPVGPVELTPGCAVEFEPRVIDASAGAESDDPMPRIHALLRGGAETGIIDLAARHDEHQP